MSNRRLQVLFEDNHLLVVNKPAGLPTMGAASGEMSLVTLAKQYIKKRYAKPGNVYLGVVSRLDALVTGVVVLARTSKAAARLTEQFRSRKVRKTYWALVEGAVAGGEHACKDWMVKDERAKRMRIAAAGKPDAAQARLTYRRLRSLAGMSLVEIALETGRKHQIRVQLAHRGHPVVGDEKYGSRRRFPVGIALHARRVALVHPVKGEPLQLEAAVPPSWKSLGVCD